MGNCLSHCLGKLKAWKFLRTRYYEKDYSVEDGATDLPQSIDSDDDLLTFFSDDDLWPILTPECSQNLKLLLHENAQQDAIAAKQLAQDEEELRLEEEAFIEASKEAVRVARLANSNEIINPANLILRHGQMSNDNHEEWNIVRATSDYDIFLENAGSKSQSTKQAVQGQNSITETGSTTSSIHKDRTFSNTNSTPPSEVELEWDNESGIVPGMTAKPRSRTEEDLASLVKHSRTIQSSPSSNELEWDNDFVRADTEVDISPEQEMTSMDLETEHLISEIEKLTSLAEAEEEIPESR